MAKIFFGDELISDSLLYCFDVRYIPIDFAIPDEIVVESEFKNACFFAWC